MPSSAPRREVVGVYARASKDKTERRISVDRQVVQTSAMVEQHFPGAEIRVYVDNDMSAADPDVFRPDYHRFLTDIRRGELTQVAGHAQARAARQPSEWNELVVTLTKAGITKLHTCLGGIIPVDPGNRLVGSIMNLIDAEEVERTKARQRAAQEQIRAEGRPGGPAGYGHRNVIGPDGRAAYEIHPEEADTIRRICDAICDGRSVSSIADRLNDGTMPSAPTRRGGKWTAGAVSGLVVRPSLAGLRSRTVQADVATGRPQHEEITGIARWEPIISESRWRQTLDALNALTVTGIDGKTHVVTRRSSPRARRWLLSTGLGRCGVCDGILRAVSVNGGRGYSCSKRAGGCGGVMITPAADVETWVYRQLVHYLAENPRLAAAVDVDDPVRDRLEEDRRQAKRAMDEADVLLGEGEIDRVRWRTINGGAKARFERAQAAIDALPVLETDVPDVDTISERWEQLPLPRQQAALDHYIDKVIVQPANRHNNQIPRFDRIAARVEIVWRQRS